MKKKVLMITLFALVCLVAVSFSSNVNASTLEDLSDKFESSGNNPTVYKLKESIILNDQLTVNQDNIVIDLDGNTITSNLDTPGILVNSSDKTGSVKITGGKIISNNYIALQIKGSIVVTLKDIEINTTTTKNASSVQVGSIDKTAGHLIVESGTKITCEGSSADVAIGVFGENSILEVNGGELFGEGYGISGNGSQTTNSTITINGGKITSKISAGIYQPQTGTLEINGGDITGGYGIVARQGDITINSGAKITAIGTDDKIVGASGVELEPGTAVIIDNKTTAGYEGKAKVVVNGGEFSAIADEALVSYGNDESDFEVNGGKYNAPFNSKFINEGKIEVGISKGEGTDTTYYVGTDAVTAIKEAAKNGKSVVEVFQGDLEIKGAVDGFTIKNSGDGIVSVNGKTVAKNENVVVDNPDSASKDNTPKTGMIDYTVYIAMVIAVVALGGIFAVKKLVK